MCVCSTAFAAKALPPPCAFDCLCGQDTAFAVCVPLRGSGSALSFAAFQVQESEDALVSKEKNLKV